jgi:hypothetical protein
MLRWFYIVRPLLAEAMAARRDTRVQFLQAQVAILRRKLGGNRVIASLGVDTVPRKPYARPLLRCARGPHRRSGKIGKSWWARCPASKDRAAYPGSNGSNAAG